MTETIDTGDVVHHGPTDERWVVAYVDGDRLAWCGWPEGEAAVADCTLVVKAQPEQRRALLNQMAGLKQDGKRCRMARQRLATLSAEAPANG